MSSAAELDARVAEVRGALREAHAEIGKRVVGQDAVVDGMLMALAEVVEASYSRIQFTPDLLPADLIGTMVYRPQTGEFVPRRGPIFAQIVLADEINRAPAKVQSALLQAMEERQITIGEQTFALPQPFMVLATQNPLEHEGTYPLPEAQLDRFLLKLQVPYPSFADEVAVVRLVGDQADAQLRRMLDPQRPLELILAAVVAALCAELVRSVRWRGSL